LGSAVCAVTCRTHTHPPAVVRLVLHCGLERLPAQALVGVDPVLPDGGRREGQLHLDLEIGVARTDVLATGLAHPIKGGHQVVHAPGDLAEGVVGLPVLGQLEGRGQAPLAGLGEEGIRLRPTFLSDPVLQEPMNEDDVGPGKIFAAALAFDHEAPAVRYELQVERWDRRTGVTATRRSALHVLQPVGKIEVARLDQLDEPLTVLKRLVLGVAEHRIALQLHEPHRRRKPFADQLGQLADDGVGVLELRSGEERGVSRDVGQDQVALPGDGVGVGHSGRPTARWVPLRGEAKISLQR